jgi:hypothetical protein
VVGVLGRVGVVGVSIGVADGTAIEITGDTAVRIAGDAAVGRIGGVAIAVAVAIGWADFGLIAKPLRVYI